ncbi:tigger transposable element-derived protein [Ceratobasidium sp. AG-Ba]|nr:tigger transposable element-derived protein [Ceratobasidium sp. AG-Ba]
MVQMPAQKRTRKPRQPRPLSVATSSQTRAQRQHLTYYDKLRIIDYYRSHEHLTQVDAVRHLNAEYPSLSQSTLSTYLSHEQEIRDYVRLHPGHLRCKRPFRVALPEVDAALSGWVLSRIHEGTRLTGDIICDRGRQICEELGVPEDRRINFSSGWLDNFKMRLGLREVWLGGERTLGLADQATPTGRQ